MMALKMRVVLLVALMGVAAVSATTPVVETTYGKVSGKVVDGANGPVSVFHSIPFAAPPTGKLRFARPQPPTPWTDTKDAAGFPNICPQLHIVGDLFLGNEDCLYLHVYAPQTTSNVKLPVMFWIFGGGYVLGDGYEFGFYDGVNMATKHNVIVVAANYRVGSLGFLSLPELQDADPKHSTGNMALLDQTLALEWTRDNIAAFGGDPSKVSIFGESAGGFSVCWHLVSPSSAGLFSAAIMESGTCESRSFFQNIDNAFAFGKNVTESFGCPPSGPDTLSCLQTVSIDKIMNSNAEAKAKYQAIAKNMEAAKLPAELAALAPAMAPVMPWGPVIDGVALVDFPYQSISAGTFNKVPTIFGTNKNEGRIFIPALPLMVPGTHFPPQPQDLDAAMEHFFKYYTTNTTMIDINSAKVQAQYPSSHFANEWYRVSKVVTDWFFTCGTRRAARAVAAHGVPIYVYQFTYPLDWIEYGLLGDYHTSEIDFVFGNQWPPILHGFYKKSDWELSEAMGDYWTNMAKGGAPNDATTGLDWPKFNGTTYLTMNLTWPLNVVSHLEEETCDFWDAILATMPGAS